MIKSNCGIDWVKCCRTCLHYKDINYGMRTMFPCEIHEHEPVVDLNVCDCWTRCKEETNKIDIYTCFECGKNIKNFDDWYPIDLDATGKAYCKECQQKILHEMVDGKRCMKCHANPINKQKNEYVCHNCEEEIFKKFQELSIATVRVRISQIYGDMRDKIEKKMTKEARDE